MQKTLIIFAAAVAAFALAACDKALVENAPETVRSSGDIKININVADFGGADTKAVMKTAWANGDQISIWYDSNVQTDPDLVIKYDGTAEKWEVDNTATLSGNTPSGTILKAVYSNGVIVAANGINYTYDGSELSANINSWTHLAEIQVVVSGLTSADAANYTLVCDKFTPLSGNGYTVGSDAITVSAGTKGAAATGIANTDGVAFVFATNDSYGSSADYSFTLSASGKTMFYTAGSKSVTKNTSKVVALKMQDTEFHEGVQLWADGPYWATTNIGATSETDYGYYFAWGYTDGYVRNDSNDGWVKASDSSSSITFTYDGFSDYQTHTYSDMAAANWGTAWNVPEKTDFDNLLSNCTIEYITTGTIGIKVTGNTDGYTDKSIFLPAAGYGGSKSQLEPGVYGYYWSSTQSSTPYSYRLYFQPSHSTSGVSGTTSYGRYYGFSVRPVHSSL